VKAPLSLTIRRKKRRMSPASDLSESQDSGSTEERNENLSSGANPVANAPGSPGITMDGPHTPRSYPTLPTTAHIVQMPSTEESLGRSNSAASQSTVPIYSPFLDPPTRGAMPDDASIYCQSVPMKIVLNSRNLNIEERMRQRSKRRKRFCLFWTLILFFLTATTCTRD
jgi:hypothetical protein